MPQAVIKGDVDIVDVLLRFGAPINGTEKERPLSMALPRPNILKKLLEAGADINAIDSQGRTVLQDAIQYRVSEEILDLLKQFGAKD